MAAGRVPASDHGWAGRRVSESTADNRPSRRHAFRDGERIAVVPVLALCEAAWLPPCCDCSSPATSRGDYGGREPSPRPGEVKAGNRRQSSNRRFSSVLPWPGLLAAAPSIELITTLQNSGNRLWAARSSPSSALHRSIVRAREFTFQRLEIIPHFGSCRAAISNSSDAPPSGPEIPATAVRPSPQPSTSRAARSRTSPTFVAYRCRVPPH